MFPHRFTYNRWEDKTFESDAFHWRNPDGSEGGIVSDSARIDPSVFVARDAEVWPRASVGAGDQDWPKMPRVGLDCFVSFEVEIGEFVDIYFASVLSTHRLGWRPARRSAAHASATALSSGRRRKSSAGPPSATARGSERVQSLYLDA